MSDVVAVSGIGLVSAEAILNYRCGCVVDLGVVSSTKGTWLSNLRQRVFGYRGQATVLVKCPNPATCLCPYRKNWLGR